MSERLKYLSKLEAGWLDGPNGTEGEPIDPALIQLLEAWLDEHVPNNEDPPYTFPTPEGGVEIEWSKGQDSYSIEFDPQTKIAIWFETNLDSGSFHEEVFDYESAEALKNIGHKLVGHLK